MSSALRQWGKKFDDFVYRRAIELLGGGADAYIQLASRYESLGWVAEALLAYQKAIDLRPHQAEAQFKLAVLQGTVCLKTGDRVKALDLFRQAMSYSINDAGAYTIMAKAFADAEHYEEAVRAYREVIRISPRNVSAYGVMAETYAKLKQFPEALDAYRKAVELKPTADAYGILASAYARMGRYHEAVQAYQKAMKLEPGFSQTWNRLSDVYIKLEDFEQKVSAGKADEPMKKAYAKLRQEQEALEHFKETLRQSPNNPQIYIQMGQLYLDLNLPGKALDFIKHAIRLRAAGAYVHRALGMAYAGLGDNEKACKSLSQAIRVDKKDASSWAVLGQLYAKLGKYDEAINSYKEALRWKPQDGSFYRHLGDVYRLAGRFSEATRAFWQAIHLNPQDGLARYGLGVTYVRLNQRPYAIEQKAVLRTIDPKLAADLDHVIWRLNREVGDSQAKA